MLKQVNGKWALVSKKTQRPLAYYKGEGKPSDEWVRKQEARIQFFKNESVNIKPDILPPSGGGQEGTDTLVNNYKRDTPGQNIANFKDWNRKRTYK